MTLTNNDSSKIVSTRCFPDIKIMKIYPSGIGDDKKPPFPAGATKGFVLPVQILLTINCSRRGPTEIYVIFTWIAASTISIYCCAA